MALAVLPVWADGDVKMINCSIGGFCKTAGIGNFLGSFLPRSTGSGALDSLARRWSMSPDEFKIFQANKSRINAIKERQVIEDIINENGGGRNWFDKNGTPFLLGAGGIGALGLGAYALANKNKHNGWQGVPMHRPEFTDAEFENALYGGV